MTCIRTWPSGWSARAEECVEYRRMRRIAAIAAAKGTPSLSRALRFGGGTALPGLVAERIDPDIVSGMAGRLGRGSVPGAGAGGENPTAPPLPGRGPGAGLRPG